ncbi:mitochondrial ribosomal protein [Patellaria atrata CBS 101060]|uniref:37S ribosomal protein S25, mitochondrial n=1 Tax=Patellaria atrata CBS 101060 TaxID=1346257 RepID=A0A9P4SD81_9PEZI|nr:mitochondrial ribosomal protein [Patellaria atrata CBS 101060]
MGRYDFRPSRVHQTATHLFEIGRLRALPPWYNIVADFPPSQILVRPIQRTQLEKKVKRKASRMFQPAQLTYPEDRLRRDFYSDHPWELARPKIVLENDGNDSKGWDWSRIQQPEKRLDGESVIQRQMWLMHHEGLDKALAYDRARKEFYKVRNLEELERRVAKEEALHTGAYFGKTALEVGMELEDKAWEDWKAWATAEVTTLRQVRQSAYTGLPGEVEVEVTKGE